MDGEPRTATSTFTQILTSAPELIGAPTVQSSGIIQKDAFEDIPLVEFMYLWWSLYTSG